MKVGKPPKFQLVKFWGFQGRHSKVCPESQCKGNKSREIKYRAFPQKVLFLCLGFLLSPSARGVDVGMVEILSRSLLGLGMGKPRGEVCPQPEITAQAVFFLRGRKKN